MPRNRSRKARPVVPVDLCFELWPEHLAAYRLFCALGTQWAWDQGRITGLPAERVRAHPAFRALPRHLRESAFADLVVIERAYLERLDAKRARAARRASKR